MAELTILQTKDILVRFKGVKKIVQLDSEARKKAFAEFEKKDTSNIFRELDID